MKACVNGHNVPDESLFCGDCGVDVRQRCPQGHAVGVGDSFCDVCGAVLQGAAAAAASTPLVASVEDIPVADFSRHGLSGSAVIIPDPALGTTAEAAGAYPPADVPAPAPAPARSFPPPAATPLPPAPAAPTVPLSPAFPASSFPASAGAVERFHVNWHRLGRIDQVTAGCAAALILSLFLPWFGYSSGSFHYSRSGLSTHTYLALALLIAAALLEYLVARAGWDQLPVRPPVAHAPLLLLLGSAQLLLVLLAFVSKPTGLAWSFGAWLGLAAALGAALPVGIPAVQSLSGNR